jgi:NADPH-dependent F420 reductase
VKIAIIGAGFVGAALAKGWSGAGHDVVFGVRDPRAAKVGEAVGGTEGRARAAGVQAAAAGADVVVLAVPWPAVADALRQAGSLAGKVLVDATNPLNADFTGLAVGHTTSGAEEVARRAPGAKVVKAFNTIGASHMAKPEFGGVRPTMFLCGDDPAARATVRELARALGFDPVDAGPLAQARLLEPLAMLWISLAYGGYGTDIAFKLLTK